MNFLICGGTGFIGSTLCAYLLARKHTLVVKTRRPELLQGAVKGVSQLAQINTSEKFDVVINLTGEPIADKRWSKTQQQKILQSRIDATQELIDFFKHTPTKPELFISGSAIGYYGVGASDKIIDEDCVGDNSFSTRLCASWEACARQAELLGIRTCLLRTGIVLGNNGGALAKMLPLFKLGLGGKIGTGKQWMSWIHLDDMMGIIDFCIKHKNISGPINCTSPCPVTNAEFTQTLGQILKRPRLLPMPSAMIKLLFGVMGEELLLSGKKVLPVKLEMAGFQFKYERLLPALKAVLSQ